MRRRLTLNTITGLLLRFTTIVCGLILPRLILAHFGSDINGLVYSVTQFLGIISFLELGVGRVIQSALYEPLAQKDEHQVSVILTAGGKFFRRIAEIMLAYVLTLIALYPILSGGKYPWAFTAALIGAISISSFAQYYFGIIDTLLLNADQHGYVQYLMQTVTIVLNVAVCAAMIRLDASIQMVKLASSLVFLLRPLFLRWYVGQNYSIDRRAEYDGEPIKQKWNGIAQHISAVVLDNTDTVVLTMLSTLSAVSVYSVYNFVVFGVRQVYQSATEGLHSFVGGLWARKEYDKLERMYSGLESMLHLITVFLFACTWVLLIPFIRVYTDGIHDAEYVYPMFGALMVLGRGIQCLRTTYNMFILAAGHYRQTQRCYIITAVLNLGLSLLLVRPLGLVGVAIGTVAALAYQTVWMARYNAKYLIKRSIKRFFLQLLADMILATAILSATGWIRLTRPTYGAWVLMAFEVTVIAGIVTVIFGFGLFRRSIKEALYVWRRIERKHN